MSNTTNRDREAGPSTGMGGEIIPVFLFSLPRSGSTLTQRALATHPLVETASEPWILLPFLYSLKPQDVYTSYGHKLSVRAIEDFCAGLPGGETAYREEIAKLALRLYALRARPGTRFFLDKTPRYHLIAEDIIGLFPNAKFVFLWRNPLAIIASMIESWGRGRWNIYKYDVDLFDGLFDLVRVFDKYRDRVYGVRYEDLVTGSAASWQGLSGYLGLDFRPEQVESFNEVDLKGRMGDTTGRKAYSKFSTEPLEKWHKVLASPVRKAWCARYLKTVGESRLQLMGYDLSELLAELDRIPVGYRTVGADIMAMLVGSSFRMFEPWMLADKFSRLARGLRAHAHS